MLACRSFLETEIQQLRKRHRLISRAGELAFFKPSGDENNAES
jgi:hypothetical protein